MHKDTPRSGDTLGSFVVVLPTTHEGGVLHLCHNLGEEWTLDSSAITSAQEIPSVAYIMFYSDVEHSVSTVTSGYPVTLTYILYSAENTPNPSHVWMKDNKIALRVLAHLLQNYDVLSGGSYLGFGLEFVYPVAAEGTKLENLINSLNGGDAIILEQLNLNPQLKVIYKAVIEKADEIDDWEDGIGTQKEPFRSCWTTRRYCGSYHLHHSPVSKLLTSPTATTHQLARGMGTSASL